jgi:hypothetical protein
MLNGSPVGELLCFIVPWMAGSAMLAFITFVCGMCVGIENERKLTGRKGPAS